MALGFVDVQPVIWPELTDADLISDGRGVLADGPCSCLSNFAVTLHYRGIVVDSMMAVWQ